MTITAEIQPRGSGNQEGFGPEGTSTGSRAQRFEDAYKVAQEYKRIMECHSAQKVVLPAVQEATTPPKLTPMSGAKVTPDIGPQMEPQTIVDLKEALIQRCTS